MLAQIDDVPKLVTNEDGNILMSQFHPENYVGMEDSGHLREKMHWDQVFQKFAHNPAILAKIKAFIGQNQIPVQKDIDRWKHFFDFYVSKARDYKHSKTAMAAAAA